MAQKVPLATEEELPALKVSSKQPSVPKDELAEAINKVKLQLNSRRII